MITAKSVYSPIESKQDGLRILGRRARPCSPTTDVQQPEVRYRKTWLFNAHLEDGAFTASLPEGMNTAYGETRFRWDGPRTDWPTEFAVISGYATTGEQWTEGENEAADRALEAELRRRCAWVHRITGYSPTSDHREPSWAATLPFDDTCDIGLKYLQDAIYFVSDNYLFVSFCDARRKLIPVGPLLAHLDSCTAELRVRPS